MNERRNQQLRGMVELVVGVIAAIVMTRALHREWTIRHQGRLVEATVIQTATYGTKSGPVYHIGYRFMTEEEPRQVVTVDEAVFAEQFHRLPIGSTVQVRYLPRNPDDALMVGGRPTWSVPALFAGMFLLLGVVEVRGPKKRCYPLRWM